MHKNITAAEYLQKVLKDWSTFCKTHPHFKNAIQEILLENKRLKNEVKKLKDYISNMEEKIMNANFIYSIGNKEITDAEIIEALECCFNSCNTQCPLFRYKGCRQFLKAKTLNLINQLQANNKELKDYISNMEDYYNKRCEILKKDFANKLIYEIDNMPSAFPNQYNITLTEEKIIAIIERERDRSIT